MSAESIYDSRDEASAFILRQAKKASELEVDDVVIPAETQRWLDEEDGVLGSSKCPPIYSIDEVRDNGRRIVAQVHAMGNRRNKQTFYMDHDKEVNFISAKTVWSMRADESRREVEKLKSSGASLGTMVIDGTPVPHVGVGELLASHDVQAFVEAGGMIGSPGCPRLLRVNAIAQEGDETVFTVQRLDDRGVPFGSEREMPFPTDEQVLTARRGATVHGIGPWGQS